METNTTPPAGYVVLSTEQIEGGSRLSVEVENAPDHCPYCDADKLVRFGRRTRCVVYCGIANKVGVTGGNNRSVVREGVGGRR